MENNDGLWWLMVAVGDGESAWNFKIAFYGDARGGPCDHKEVLQAMGCRRP